MKPRILLATLVLVICQLAYAHVDTIIRLNGEKLEGLPPQYQPASFSIENRRLEVGVMSVVIPACLWKYFGRAGRDNLRFHASWYHDSSILPPYIVISVDKVGTTTSYEFIINLDTLAVVKFTEVLADGEQTAYQGRPIPPACTAEWKVVRKK